MEKSRMLRNLSWLFFMGGCASTGGGRGPAQVGATVPLASAQGPNMAGVGRNGAGGHGGPQGAPGAPAQGNPPVSGGAAPEAKAKCSVDLGKVGMGGSYSVSDVLFRMEVYGSFTGQTELDRAYLAPNFGRNIGPGTEIFEAAKHSRPFYRALQFITGASGDYQGTMSAADYAQSARLAAVLAALITVRFDSECVIYVQQRAQRILSPEYAAELSTLPFVKAAEDLRGGRIAVSFKEVDDNRTQIFKELETLDGVIAKKVRASEKETALAQRELDETFQRLRLKLVKIPACVSTIEFTTKTTGPMISEKEHYDSLVAKCQQQIDSTLADARDEEIRLTSKITRLTERREKTGTGVTVEEAKAQDLLGKVQAKVGIYQGYLDRLLSKDSEDDEKSIVAEQEDLNEIETRRRKLVEKEFIREEQQQKAALELRWAGLSGTWLTYNFVSRNANR